MEETLDDAAQIVGADHSKKDGDELVSRIAALRTRAEQAERERDEARSWGRQIHEALDGKPIIFPDEAPARIATLAAERDALRARAEQAERMAYHQEQRRYREQSEKRTRRRGYEPGTLQWKWRNPPGIDRPADVPPNYDPSEVEDAICDALTREGCTAWSGDGVGCVEQIVRAQAQRAVQAERERDEYMRQFQREEIAAGYAISEAEELEAERDALRAEAGRLMGVLRDAYELANSYKGALERTHRGELTDVANDGPMRRRIEAVLSSTPLSASLVERWKAMERVAEAAKEYRRLVPLQGCHKDDFDEAQKALTQLLGAFAALDRTEKPHGLTRDNP